MLTKQELEDAIYDIEDAPSNYSNCEKLAMLYTIYDHLYEGGYAELSAETVIGDYGDSEFLKAVRNRPAYDVWLVIDELVTTLEVVNPRLYDAFMRKVAL